MSTMETLSTGGTESDDEEDEVEGVGIAEGRKGNVILKYVPLGGVTHNDTEEFDSTHCLWGMVTSLSLCVSTTVIPAGPLSQLLPVPLVEDHTVIMPPSLQSVMMPTVSASTPPQKQPLSLPRPLYTEGSLCDMLDTAAVASMASMPVSGTHHIFSKSVLSGSLDSSSPSRIRKNVPTPEGSIWQSLRVSSITIFAGRVIDFSFDS